MSIRYPFLRLHNSYPVPFCPHNPRSSCAPDPNVLRFPAALPSNAVPLVCTSVNINTVQPAPLSNPEVPTSLRYSFHVQAAAGSQNYVESDFKQANPFLPQVPPQLLSLQSLRHRIELPFRIPCVGVTPRIPHLRLLLRTPPV